MVHAVVFAVPLALVIAADATLDPVTALVVNGGIIGVFFALALLGQIALKPEINRRDDQEKRQQALIDTLLAVYHHEVLPWVTTRSGCLRCWLVLNENLWNLNGIWDRRRMRRRGVPEDVALKTALEVASVKAQAQAIIRRLQKDLDDLDEVVGGLLGEEQHDDRGLGRDREKEGCD